ncbi:MAG TPA: undecaprenyldiphospho-muramoylpentapeptide beta-N-acetylglucosaminyltransferase [Bacteroidetes bacterium]|nr:undecaprenyldiphospho-muramoylpentapeptide beta-N-acetylglucosaminyltransferase [Bacteroidota bacterium]
MNRPLKVIISGGGTGGHVFPAISIAGELKRTVPGTDILFVGAEGKIEMEKVPAAGFPVEGLPVRGFDRKKLWKNFAILIHLWKSMTKSRKIVRQFNPDVVVGVGGYASGPVVKTAEKMGIPVLIQEQNSYAGVTNRLLAAKASVICVAYEGMEKYFPKEKIVLTGNPVREEIVNSMVTRREALAFFNIPDDLKVILVLGGSLGASTINRAILQHLNELQGKSVFLIWQTGRYYYEGIMNNIKRNEKFNVLIQDFIQRMDMAYAAATVIISRAGAGTISELAVVGKPVILVPSPNVVEDHQTKNAIALVKQEAAEMIPDSEAEENLMRYALALLEDPVRMKILSENMKKMARPYASRDIVKKILDLTVMKNE